MATLKTADVLQMSAKPENPAGPVEIIDADELGRRLQVPASWIYRHTTLRYPAAERIPCVKLGRYTRFRWNSPELTAWLKSLETR